MFKEGHIFFIKDFEFNNGGEPQDKYFIVLKETKKDIIIGTLPTRNNKVPNFVDKEHGCINIQERMYNCYLFKPAKAVCENGFSFDLPTFIYGGDVDNYSKTKLLADYPEEGKHFVTIGKLNPAEFNGIIDCFRNSNAVNRGIKRELAA